jgi:hypothetical protein
MMKSRALLLPFLLVLASCTANGGMIYSVLETEVKQPKTGLGTNGEYLTIQDLALLGTNYYIAGGKIWYTDATAASSTLTLTWTEVTTPKDTRKDPAHPLPTLCTAMAASAAKLYAGFINADGTSAGLWSTTGPAVAFTQETPVGLGAGDQIVRILCNPASATCPILLVTATPVAPPASNPSQSSTYHTYNLYRWDGSSPLSLVYSTGDVAILDASLDPGTDTYYFVAGQTYYSGLFGSITPVSTIYSPITSLDFLQAASFIGGTIYVGCTESGVFVGPGSTHYAADVQSNKYVGYLTFADAGGGKVLVGSDGYGYYVISGSTITRYTNLSLTLYTSAVRRFLVDTPRNRVLAGTSGAGMWVGTLNTAGDSQTVVSGWTRQ